MHRLCSGTPDTFPLVTEKKKTNMRISHVREGNGKSGTKYVEEREENEVASTVPDVYGNRTKRIQGLQLLETIGAW